MNFKVLNVHIWKLDVFLRLVFLRKDNNIKLCNRLIVYCAISKFHLEAVMYNTVCVKVCGLTLRDSSVGESVQTIFLKRKWVNYHTELL